MNKLVNLEISKGCIRIWIRTYGIHFKFETRFKGFPRFPVEPQGRNIGHRHVELIIYPSMLSKALAYTNKEMS